MGLRHYFSPFSRNNVFVCVLGIFALQHANIKSEFGVCDVCVLRSVCACLFSALENFWICVYLRTFAFACGWQIGVDVSTQHSYMI